MCLETLAKRNVSQWNWDGDFIVHKCIVPSSRPIVGFARGHQYDIDVREFLITSRNEVIRRTLDEKIREFVKDRVIGGWEKFQSRDEGSFDFRANVIKNFVSHRISYEPTQEQDPWQFPDETLAIKNGDCEDRALLIASLMIASGISSYNVRVVLGKMKFSDRKGHTFTGDHVWVMYKTEVGRWLVIEPTVTGKGRLKETPVRSNCEYEPIAGEYIPYYVFNDQHLWQWPAAGLIDTILRSCSLPFELHRTEIPQGGVPPRGIVKALDVIKHVGFRLVACAVCGARRALGLQRGEEAFHRRVVPAVAGAAHATSQALVCQQSLERLTGILAAPSE